MKPQITIITPAYNAGNCIGNCIESILKQTYYYWQLYVIDDGSTDNTLQFVKRYSALDERIKVFNKENGGVSSARNVGIQNIDTPYFVCIDADDSVEPKYLESLIKAHESYPTNGHIWCGFQTVSTQDKKDAVPILLDSQKEYLHFSRRDYIFLYENWYVQMPWHRLYQTAIVKQNNILMDEELSLGEDLLFNLEYLDATENTSILIVNQANYNYVRTDNDSLDHRYRPDLLEIYSKLDKKVWFYLNKWNIDNEGKKTYFNSCFYHYETVLRNTFHVNNKASFLSKIKFNNRILSDEAFKKCLDEATCYINPLYKSAYKIGRYELVLLLDKLVSLKKGRK